MEFNGDWTRGVVEPIVLRLVAERPMYGYEIIRVVNERTNRAFEWKEGTLYPCLHRLESAGLISGRWMDAESGRRRRYYAITRKGAAVLAEKSGEWSAFARAVNALLLAGSGVPA